MEEKLVKQEYVLKMTAMKDKKITEEELKKEGWDYILTLGYNLKIFKKGKKALFWDSKTQKVTHEFSEW